MTTIAYRNNILASDTQMTWGTERYLTKKIKVLPNGIVIACSGTIEQEYKAHEVFGDPKWEENELSEALTDFACILLINKKPYFCADNFIPIPILDDRFAIGSGGAYALSAMYFDYEAPDAVRFASRFDIHTNNIVETYANT